MRRTLLLFLLLLVIAIPQTGFVQNGGYSGSSRGSSVDLTAPGPIGGTTASTIYNTDQYFYASGVSHGMTSIAGTHDYGAAFFMSSDIGGLDLYGLTDANSDGALRLTGIIGSTDPTDSYAAVHIRGGKKNGTGWQALGNAETIAEFYNYTTKVGRVYGNGEWILTSLQNTPIGSTIAAAGTFTDVTVTGTLTASPTFVISAGTTAVTTKNTYVVCSTTCTVTPLTPAAGVQLCVRNAPGVATAITLAALTGSITYELTDHSAWATANQKFVASASTTAAICIVGYSSLHYITMNSTGTWSDTP